MNTIEELTTKTVHLQRELSKLLNSELISIGAGVGSDPAHQILIRKIYALNTTSKLLAGDSFHDPRLVGSVKSKFAGDPRM